MIPVMNITRQFFSIQEEIEKKALEVLRNGQYILGRYVEDFEKSFAEYCGVKYAVGVGNGSDALVIALKACGIGSGDEVITTAMSFSATAEAIASLGAVPVFADCNLDTYTIDPEMIKNRITNKTKAIIPVHLYGQCADMDAINDLAKNNNIKVIEDCAQAVGAKYREKKAGSIGDVGCFSFFPTKNLGCAGDGGIIITDNEDIYRKCRAYRSHGSGIDGLYTYGIREGLSVDDMNADYGDHAPKYFNYVQGYNSRLDALQAGILSIKLRYLDSWNEMRIKIANQYNNYIYNPTIKLPIKAEYNKHVYYVYIITTNERDKLKNFLKDNDIGSGVYFPVPFHLQTVYKNLNYKKGDFPNAEYIADHSLVLPMFPELTQDEVEYVINTVNTW